MTVSGTVTEGVAVDCAASLEAFSGQQMASLAAVHEHVRDLTDKLAARFIFWKGITLVLVQEGHTIKTAQLTQVHVRKTEQKVSAHGGSLEPRSCAVDPALEANGV